MPVSEQKDDKHYFMHNSTKIVISEHFNERGKSLKEVIKNAIYKEERPKKKQM